MSAKTSVSLANLERYDAKLKAYITDKLDTFLPNKNVIDKLSESANGTLLFDGKEISTSDNVLLGNIKKFEVVVTVDGQVDFVTDIDGSKVDINTMNNCLYINGQLYVDEIDVTLDSNNKVNFSWRGDFQLETTDSIYLFYCEKTTTTISDSDGSLGLSSREW